MIVVVVKFYYLFYYVRNYWSISKVILNDWKLIAVGFWFEVVRKILKLRSGLPLIMQVGVSEISGIYENEINLKKTFSYQQSLSRLDELLFTNIYHFYLKSNLTVIVLFMYFINYFIFIVLLNSYQSFIVPRILSYKS